MDSNRNLFWQFAEQEHLKTRAFCRKLMGNRDDGDDLYQDALVAAMTRFDSLRDTGAFQAWLYQIVVNIYKNRVTRSWWKRFLPLTDEVKENIAGDDPSAKYTTRRKLERAFQAVSPRDKALVILFEIEGWTLAELAKLNGNSEGAVKVRLFRARRKMREALAGFPLPTGSKKNVKPVVSEGKICVAGKPGAD